MKKGPGIKGKNEKRKRSKKGVREYHDTPPPFQERYGVRKKDRKESLKINISIEIKKKN